MPRVVRKPLARTPPRRRPRPADLPVVPETTHAQPSAVRPEAKPDPAPETPEEAAIRRMVEAAYT